ncbi:MAG: glycosyltransferase family 4 protein [Bacteroidota bacterium]
MPHGGFVTFVYIQRTQSMTEQPLKGLYLVSEPACLSQKSGAFRHIQVGVDHLNRHFEVTLFPLCEVPEAPPAQSTPAGPPPTPPAYKSHPLYGGMKDLYRWYKNQRQYAVDLERIRAMKPDFIYERAAYLNFSGIRAARELGIPHFYEANGLQYLAVKAYYQSVFNRRMEKLERKAYRASDHVFFVGTWGDRMQLSSTNWQNIENGIEESFLQQFPTPKQSPHLPLKICFVGKLMAFHRTDLLEQAMALLPAGVPLEIHLIGSGFSALEESLQAFVPVFNHGYLSREALSSLLQKMDIGLIPGGHEYPSFMKLFEYGAARLLTLCPPLHNLAYWFSDEELFFFEKNNPQALADSLLKLIEQPELVAAYGNRLHEKVAREFTWTHIFDQISGVMKDHLTSPAHA